MKIKNIGFLDAHLHKIIPLAALLFLLSVLYFYVVGQPYMVTVNNSEKAPVDVEIDVRNQAEKLDKEVNDQVKHLPDMKLIPYTQEFTERTHRSLVGKARFEVPLGPPGLDPADFPTPNSQPIEYAVVLPPPATGIVAHASYGVLALPKDKDSEDEAKAWVALVGKHDPMDIRVITVAGTFSMSEWRRRLSAEPTNNLSKVPQEWWRLALTDVILERQTFDPVANQWGSTEQIDLLPNDPFDYLRDLGENFTEGNAIQTVDKIRLQQPIIAQKPPPPLTPDHPWMPPTTDASLDEAQQKKLTSLAEEITGLQEKLRHLGPAPGGSTPRPTPSQTPAAGGGAGGHNPPAHQPAAAPAHAAPSASDPSANERAKLHEQLRQKTAEYNALRTGKPIPSRTGPGRMGPDTNVAVIPSPSEIDQVEVWAHDVTAKSGMTYRYRLSISVINPLFQKPNLVPQQRSYAQRLSLTSDSEKEKDPAFKNTWSDAITVDQDTYFYLTSANTGRSITVQVWRLFNGAWRPREFTVQPGDPIGGEVTLAGSKTPIDMSVHAVAVDIDFDAPVINQNLAQKTAKLLYLDQANGKLLSRTVAGDQTDPRLLKLRNQAPLGPVAESK